MSLNEFKAFFNEALTRYGDYSHTVTVMCLIFSITRAEVEYYLSL